jgi:hypothetical protein
MLSTIGYKGSVDHLEPHEHRQISLSSHRLRFNV